MVVYSYSRISTFEKCPLKFRFRYIDKIIPEIEKTIEAHLGKTVHSALEHLYKYVQKGKILSVDDIIRYYSSVWEKDFTPDTIIVNHGLTEKDYFNKGIQFIVSYYTTHHPFPDNTIDIEKKIFLELEESGEYKIQGFIDRLVYNLKTGEYEIHDYKTANYPPSIETLKKDRQLALYSLAIKKLYGSDKEVNLIWHFLAHNKRVRLKKTNKELEELRIETLSTIKVIEATEDFPPKKSRLCDWCEYKSICPAWGNSNPKREKQHSLDDFPTIKKYIKEVEETEEKLNIFD